MFIGLFHILYPSSFSKFVITFSMIRLKSIGFSRSPCLTPFVIVVGLDVWLFDFIRAIVSVFNCLIILTVCSGISHSIRHCITSANPTRSKALHIHIQINIHTYIFPRMGRARNVLSMSECWRFNLKVLYFIMVHY
jgi:hypothetical protein